jgi:enoyl-CoA hydratase
MSVRMETIGPVLVVTIDRPEVRNAVDAPTANALVDVFRAFDTDSRALAAVLTGADGTFCAGADLKAISQGTGNRVDAPPANGPLGVTRMVLGKPVIAAVEGFAVAGAGAHPLVRSARRRLECRLRRVLPAFGSAAGDGGTIRLPRLIGHSHALDMILTGRGVTGDEALRRASPTALPRQAMR